MSASMLASLILVSHVAAQSLDCWDGVFTAELCCDLSRSPWGRPECWSGGFSYDSCCPKVSVVQQSVHQLSRRLDGLEELLTRDGKKPGAALGYLRIFVPAKFELIQQHRKLKGKQARAHGRLLDQLFAKERAFRSRLQDARMVHVPKIIPPRHSYCKRTWSVSLFADCATHLRRIVDALTNQQQLKPNELADMMHEGFCSADQSPVIRGFQQTVSWPLHFESDLELVTMDLLNSECLAESIAIYVTCSLSRIARALQEAGQSASLVASAADLLEGASLRMLLCDGCRRDGRGQSVIALDQALWTLGFLRNGPRETVGQKYQSAIAQFERHPEHWWRDSPVDGRISHCPMALKKLCVQRNQLMLGHQSGAPAALGSCHLDFTQSDFTPLKALPSNSTARYAWSSQIAFLVPLNVFFHSALTHPTGFFTWFLPTLMLMHGGEKTRKLLSAVWRRDGIPTAPDRLKPETTEVFLVPYGDSPETRAVKKSPFGVFLDMLSSQVRSIQELQHEERHCFRTALWGFPDPSLRLHGDLDWKDAQYFRGAFRSHLRSPGNRPSPLGPSMRNVGIHIFSTKASETAFETRVTRNQRDHIGLVFAYRSSKISGAQPERKISNQEALLEALGQLVKETPPLHLMCLSWEKLPLVDQVLLAIDFMDILVQPFGAGMSWSLFMPPGSYVVELQQDSIDTAHFVSCFRPSMASSVQKGLSGYHSPWEANNRHSEWGAWSFMNKVNFACVSNRPTYAHCKRFFEPFIWDTPSIAVDIGTVTTLVADAARRLTYAANRTDA